MKDDQRQRLQELLADHAVGTITADEQSELDTLLSMESGMDTTGFERAAAAVMLTGPVRIEPMPQALARRILASAPGELGAKVVDLSRRPEGPYEREVSGFRWGNMGWLAAAAALALALFAWMRGPGEGTLDPDQARSALMASAGDVIQTPWTATDDVAAGGAAGDIVWSTDAQNGYMLIQGLEPNDPSVEQYQLWIFDKERDERYPVDGGVFDIPEGATEVVVPIRAKLEVNAPFLFAITVEPPGGVVVSSRERIVLLGQVPGDS